MLNCQPGERWVRTFENSCPLQLIEIVKDKSSYYDGYWLSSDNKKFIYHFQKDLGNWKKLKNQDKSSIIYDNRE